MKYCVQLAHSVRTAGTWHSSQPSVWHVHVLATTANGSMAMERMMRTAAKAEAKAKERPIIALKFRFYCKEREGIFSAMSHILSRHYEEVFLL